MSALHTRRQLRDALESERSGRAHFKKRAEELQALLDKVEPKLEADGWTATRQPGFVVVSMSSDKATYPPASDWNAPDRAAAEQRVVADAVNGARRGVLTTVINALGIKGYARNTSLDTDRFWADLQTAIEVREEKRVADERSATEEKVSRLSRGENPFLVSRIAVDPQDSILDPQALRDLLRGGRIQVAEPYPDFAFGSSYGTAHSKSRTHAGQPPAPDKKKPAKKKSEDKK